MVCRFCGLPTENDLGHTTETECIEALEHEVVRLKSALEAIVPGDIVKAADHENSSHRRASVAMRAPDRV